MKLSSPITSTITLLMFIALTAMIVLPHPTMAAGRVLEDAWYSLTLGDSRLGWMHAKVREIETDGKTIIESTTETSMTLNRMGMDIEISNTSTFRDNSAGEPLSFSSQLKMSAMETVTSGTVNGKRLQITQSAGGSTVQKDILLDDDTVFPSSKFQQRILSLIGETSELSLKVFVPDFMTVVGMKISVLGRETISVQGQSVEAIKTMTTMELMPNAPTTEWIDQKGNILQFEMPMMGTQIRGRRSSKSEAMAKEGKAAGLDIFTDLLIKPDKEIDNPEELTGLSLKLTFREGVPAHFIEDDRQRIILRDDNSLSVLLRRQQLPPAASQPIPASVSDEQLREFVEASSFIQSNDPDIIARARSIIADEKDTIAAATRIIEWVYKGINKKNLTVGFASAREVLSTMEGDCSEHSVLAIALCRAVGIPARACVGLMYSPQMKVFGYHMWIEVNAGNWYQMDPTFNQTTVSPTHILISRGSMDGRQLMIASSAVNDFAAGLTISILEQR